MSRVRPRRIHFLRVLQSLLGGKNENLLEHLDDVIVSVIVIIEQHYLIELCVFRFARRSNSRCCNGLAQLHIVSQMAARQPCSRM